MRSGRFRRAVDALMGVGLLRLMSCQVTGEAGHEWTGIGMTALMLLHQVLNRKWYAALTFAAPAEPASGWTEQAAPWGVEAGADAFG